LYSGRLPMRTTFLNPFNVFTIVSFRIVSIGIYFSTPSTWHKILVPSKKQGTEGAGYKL